MGSLRLWGVVEMSLRVCSSARWNDGLSSAPVQCSEDCYRVSEVCRAVAGVALLGAEAGFIAPVFGFFLRKHYFISE